MLARAGKSGQFQPEQMYSRLAVAITSAEHMQSRTAVGRTSVEQEICRKEICRAGQLYNAARAEVEHISYGKVRTIAVEQVSSSYDICRAGQLYQEQMQNRLFLARRRRSRIFVVRVDVPVEHVICSEDICRTGYRIFVSRPDVYVVIYNKDSCISQLYQGSSGQNIRRR